ncbi:MAG: hypothetical protein IK048_01020 [Clostridia bacterium]|nr:hypothetical protein [Clostridia bacterium]
MKTASKVMYTIGRVFNIIELVGFAILIILGILFMTVPSLQSAYAEEAAEAGLEVDIAAKAAGLTMIITGVILFLVLLVVCLLAGHASKALNNGRKDNVPHILMIIVGIFGDIFYLLGGIFGIVAENEEAKEAAEAPAEVQEAKADEVPEE